MLTLHDLEHSALLRLRDFEGVSSFAAAGLGHLARQPRVAAAFTVPPAVIATGVPHAVTAAEVMQHLADAFDAYETPAPAQAASSKSARKSKSGGGKQRSAQPKPAAERSDIDPMAFDLAGALDTLAVTRGLRSGVELCVYVRAEKFVKYALFANRQANRNAASRATRALEVARREGRATRRAARLQSASGAYESLAALCAGRAADATTLQLVEAALPELSAASERWACTLPEALAAVVVVTLCGMQPGSPETALALDRLDQDALEEALLEEISTRARWMRAGETPPGAAAEPRGAGLGLVWLLSHLQSRLVSWLAAAGAADAPILLVYVLQTRPRLGDALSRAVAAMPAEEAAGTQPGGASATPPRASTDGDAPVAAPAREEEVLDHVCALLASLAPAAGAGAAGDAPLRAPLAALCAAEAQLLAERRCGAFEELGLGSFAAFVARHAAEVCVRLPAAAASAAGGQPGGVVGPPRTAVLAVARAVTRSAAVLASAAGAAASADAEAVAAAVAAHFGAADLAQLGGFDSAAALLEEAQSAALPTSASPPITAAALAFAPGGAAALLHPPAAGPLGALSGEDVARALARCPPMADVAEWLHWPALFQPTLGAAGPALGRAHATLAAAASPRRTLLLEASHGAFMLLPADASVAAFASALAAGDGGTAAAHALGLVAAAEHVSLAPLALLRSHAATHFASHSGDGAASAALVRDALLATPAALRLAVAAPVFLAPLLEAASAAPRALLAACEGQPAALRALHALGWQLGVREWVDDLRERLFTAELSAAPSAAATAAAVASAAPASVAAAAAVAVPEAAPAASAAAAAPAPQPPLAPPVLDEGAADANAALCADIARGYGFVLDASGAPRPDSDRADVRNLQRGYARATQRLAAELYASDIHFVLELVQNADDCAYAPGASPALRVALSAADVRFSSNERGFSERDVRALCAVGDSTKKAGDVGFIGQKGIGFKSVFKVSQRPEVHSRCWHFAFDASDGGLGYILPRPLAAPAGWDAAEGGTLIVLPLDAAPAGRERDVRADLTRRLDDLHPSLLIFLNRLRQLHVTDAVTGMQRRMTRLDDAGDDGVVVIEDVRGSVAGDAPEESLSERWLRVSAVLTVPPHAARAGIAATRLALALPLLPREALAPGAGPLPDQEVFAFLPLRSYGFRFLLQGDWVVPSSREAVDTGSAWNQWLREEVPALFERAALEVVRRAAALAQPDAASPADVADAALLMDTLFRVIPLRGSVLDFFAPCVAPLLARLAGVALVPVAGGGFVPPPLAVLPPADAEAAAAMAPHLARLGLAFVSPHVDLPPAAAAALGVRACDAPLLLELLAAAAAAWAAPGADSAPDHAWLAWALDAMSSYGSLSELLPRLTRLRLLPLDCGALAAAADGGIYELADEGAADGASDALDAAAAAATGARLLHPGFAREAAARAGAARVLGRMGVSRVSGATFLSERVLPALGDAATPPGALLPLLRLVKARADAAQPRARREQLLAALAAAQPRLLTADGAAAPAADVHLGAPYAQPELARFATTAGLPWPQAAADYVGGEGGGDAASWAAFLRALGAEPFAHVRRERRELSRAALAASPWAAAARELPNAPADEDEDGRAASAAAFVVDDWASPQLEALLAAVQASGAAAAARLLLSELAAAWGPSGLAERLVATVRRADDPAAPPARAPSSLAAALRAHAWLEGTPGGDAAAAGSAAQQQPQLRRGGELFEPTAELRELLGDAVPYLRLPPGAAELPAELLAALGVRREAPPALLLDLLEGFAAAPAFSASVLTMARVYGALWQHRAALAPRLAAARWVFVPEHPRQAQREAYAAAARRRGGGYRSAYGAGGGGADDAPLRGSFYAARDCVWSDDSHLLDSLKGSVSDAIAAVANATAPPRVLCRYYEWVMPWGNVLTELGVPRQPSAAQYRAVLLEAASGRHARDASVLAAQRVFGGWAGGGGWLDLVAALAPQPQPQGGAAAAELLLAPHAEEDDWGAPAAGGARAAFAAGLLRELRGCSVVPTSAGSWAALEEVLFLDDAATAGSVATPWGDVYRLGPDLLRRCVTMRLPSSGAMVVPEAQEKLVRFYCAVMGLRPLSAAAAERCVVPPGALPRAGAACRELVLAAAVLQRWSARALAEEPAAREELAARARAATLMLHPEPLRRVLELSGAAAADGAPAVLTQPLEDATPCRVFMDVDAAHAAPPVLHLAAGSEPHAPVEVALALSKLLGPYASAAQRTAAAAALQQVLPACAAAPAPALARVLQEQLARRLGPPPEGAEAEPPWLPLDAALLADASPALAPAAEATAGPTEDAGLALALAARAAAEADAAADDAAGAAGAALDGDAGPDAALALALSRMPFQLSDRPRTSAGLGTRLGTGGFAGRSGGAGNWVAPAPGAPLAAFVEEWAGADPDGLPPPPGAAPSDDAADAAAAAAQAIGRWGEAYVAALLARERPGARVRWLNEAAETGQPYDICVGDASLADADVAAAAADAADEALVEVKTTVRADAAARFEMSLGELECARQARGGYAVYRVVAAPGARVRILRLRDPAAALAAGALKLLVQL